MHLYIELAFQLILVDVLAKRTHTHTRHTRVMSVHSSSCPSQTSSTVKSHMHKQYVADWPYETWINSNHAFVA